MTLMKRDHEGWFWPKTVLDFVASRDVPYEHLDEIMDALDALLDGRGVSVTIQDVLVYGEDRFTTPELIFEVDVPLAELESERDVQAAWYSAIRQIAPHVIHYVQLHLLPEQDAPEP